MRVFAFWEAKIFFSRFREYCFTLKFAIDIKNPEKKQFPAVLLECNASNVTIYCKESKCVREAQDTCATATKVIHEKLKIIFIIRTSCVNFLQSSQVHLFDATLYISILFYYANGGRSYPLDIFNFVMNCANLIRLKCFILHDFLFLWKANTILIYGNNHFHTFLWSKMNKKWRLSFFSK